MAEARPQPTPEPSHPKGGLAAPLRPVRHPVIEADLAWITSTPLPWETLAGKSILITGAAGFLPALMAETVLYLNESNHRANPSTVIALVRNPERARERFAAYGDRPDLRFLIQDVCEPIDCSTPVDFIIHAASQASPKYFGVDPVGTLKANVLGTMHLLNLAQTHRPRALLFFSSGEVYGEPLPHQVPTAEDAFGHLDPAAVRSCYAESKRAGETLCVSWAKQFGVPAKIVRPFHTYGPGMRLDDGRVFADFVADVLNHRDIAMHSEGSARRAFCYLADAVVGFFTVLFKGIIGQAYNIGNDRGELSILELATLIARLHPGGPLAVIRNQDVRPADYLSSPISRNCPDVSKAAQLGWTPTILPEEGFRRTILSFL